MDSTVKVRRGRPRAYNTNADRQRQYRKRQKLTRPPETDNLHDWNRYLATIGLGVSRGLFLPDAPEGYAKLRSGGNDERNLELQDARRESVTGGGRRVTPKGHGPDE